MNESKKVCSNCKNDYIEEDKYCRFCGHLSENPIYTTNDNFNPELGIFRSKHKITKEYIIFSNIHTCDKCNHQWKAFGYGEDTQDYCPQCGNITFNVVKDEEYFSKNSNLAHCPNCKNTYTLGDKYCRFCGSSVTTPIYFDLGWAGVQIMYGPMYSNNHICDNCGYTWESSGLGYDNRNWCPQCGTNVPPTIKNKTQAEEILEKLYNDENFWGDIDEILPKEKNQSSADKDKED